MTPIKLLIIDDHPILRRGICELLATTEEIRVVGEAQTGAEGFTLAHTLRPDVVLLDLSLPDTSGFEVTKRLRQTLPEARIVVLSMHDSEGYVLQALDVGAHGYVLKGSHSRNILDAIRAVARGEHFLCPLIRGDIIGRFLQRRNGAPSERPYDRLSDREQQVFRLLAEGLSTIGIAAQLCISPKTVEKHRVNVLKKLELGNLVELVKYAISLGLVDLGPSRR